MSGRYEVLTGVGGGGDELAAKVNAAKAAGATTAGGVSIAVGTATDGRGLPAPVVIYAQAVEWPPEVPGEPPPTQTPAAARGKRRK